MVGSDWRNGAEATVTNTVMQAAILGLEIRASVRYEATTSSARKMPGTSWKYVAMSMPVSACAWAGTAVNDSIPP